MPRNRRILFARVPQGLPVPADFGQDTVEAAAPGPGQFLSRTLWLSLDPFLRNVMKGHALYGVALRPGDPMHGETVAQVVESRHPGFAPGEFLVVKNGWQEYALSDGQGVRKVDPTLAPPTTALGVLGMPGLTGYAGLVYLGEPRPGQTVAQVVESRHPGFAPGEFLVVKNGWQEYALSDGQGVRKVDPTLAPVTTALGVLGMPGLTGYAGLVYLGEPRPGQTVLVSAATGAVGSTVGQLARLMGARAVGIAGSDEKCRYAVEELGYEACLNHRSGDLRAAIKQACPDGVDVYFDNVGGDVLVAAIGNLALNARIVLCGMPAAYSLDAPPAYGPWLGPVVAARATIRGLVVYDHFQRMAEMQKVIGRWIREGRFRYREEVTDGLENAPEAFCRLMRGQNFGKSLVRVAAG